MILLIVAQTALSHVNDPGNKAFLKRSLAYRKFTGQDTELKIGGIFRESEELCGKWIRHNLPKGSRLAVSKPSEGKAIYFFSGGDYPVFQLPVIYDSDTSKTVGKREISKNVIFISSWSAQVDPRNYLVSMTEDDLNFFVKENNIEYVVVNKRRNYLTKYFDSNPGYLKVIEFEGGSIKVYQIKKIEKLKHFKPMVSDYLILYLRTLKKENPQKIKDYIQNFFMPVFGWDDSKVKEILALNDRNESQTFVYVMNGKVY